MKRILFIITTNVNMGDLSLCLEWVNELGRKEFQHAFVLDRSLQHIIQSKDTLFFYEKDLHVKDSILEAASTFKADVIIFASNSYWNIRGQKGAETGKWDEEILGLDIPLLSFDPLEGLTEFYIDLWDRKASYPPLPENIWSLRDSPNTSSTSNIRHFRILKRFEQLTDTKKNEILKCLGVDMKKKTVIFPIAKNCYLDSRKVFYDYYAQLARLFNECRTEAVQFLILAPEKIHEFDICKNVVQIGHQSNERFLEILKASDIYLTDCGVASSFLHAMSSSIPSVLLRNSYNSRDKVCEDNKRLMEFSQKKISGKISFIFDRLSPYQVFPYGMVDLFNYFEKIYHTEECYLPVEVFESDNFSNKISSLLSDTQTRRSLIDNCNELRSLFMKLQSPASIIEEVLSR
jgi:hypothetical protein